MPPPRDGTSLWYRSLGRNKKSVTLDLKTEQGRALARSLLETADVVVELVPLATYDVLLTGEAA